VCERLPGPIPRASLLTPQPPCAPRATRAVAALLAAGAAAVAAAGGGAVVVVAAAAATAGSLSGQRHSDHPRDALQRVAAAPWGVTMGSVRGRGRVEEGAAGRALGQARLPR
jgi:hypothetical protein